MHRFFVPPEWIDNEKIIFHDDIARQMKNVLRIGAGEKVVALDNMGNEYLVEVGNIKQEIEGKILTTKKNHAEPSVNLTLLFALAQREKVEWILQKGTEIGVSRFIPLVTDRSLVRETGSVESKMERWNTILKEATEQSGRGIIPELENPMSFFKGLELVKHLDLGLIAWEQEKDKKINEILHNGEFRKIGVLVGPEGGFSEKEQQQAVAQGWKSISLGRRILRMETAVLVASALIINFCEQ
jgi:16S rRNA (uracil1498-N3)-methyltransferase